MKTLRVLTALTTLMAALFLAGCTTYRGGTADDYEVITPGPVPDNPADPMHPHLDRTYGPVIPPP